MAQGRQTGPVKNVKNMLAGLQLADTPRTRASDKEVVNKVTQQIAPRKVPSAGASTVKKSPSLGSAGARMGHGFGGGNY